MWLMWFSGFIDWLINWFDWCDLVDLLINWFDGCNLVNWLNDWSLFSEGVETGLSLLQVCFELFYSQLFHPVDIICCLLSFALNTGWTGKIIYFYMFFQCLGSGSVGSARFWHPGSRSRFAKICGSTKNCKKNVTLKTHIWTNVKRVIIK